MTVKFLARRLHTVAGQPRELFKPVPVPVAEEPK